MEKNRYEVVIAGLGPAGASLLYLLSEKGVNVLGIDMVDEDKLWGKPCGDAIGRHHFVETGIPEPRGEEIKQQVKGILIFSPDEDVIFKVDGEGYIIDRNLVGRRIVRQSINNGAEVLLRHRVVKPVMEGGRVKSLLIENNRGERFQVLADIFVDATGNSSAVRLLLPAEWPISERINPRDTNIAYREIRELEYDIENPEYIRIYLNQDIAPGGYWWFFPEGKNKANIGLGVQGGAGHPNPKKLFYTKLTRRDEISRYTNILSAGGSYVPTRRPLDTLVWSNMMVIGDSGYTVNPVHGGGMGYAMYAALQARNAVLKALENGITQENLWDINTGYMHTLGAKQASLDIFRIFLQKLSNDEIEYGMKYKVMKEEDVYDTSVSGEVKADISVLDKLSRILRGLGKPSLLMKLALVAEYSKKVKKLYLKYPENPADFTTWQNTLHNLYSEYISRL